MKAPELNGIRVRFRRGQPREVCVAYAPGPGRDIALAEWRAWGPSVELIQVVEGGRVTATYGPDARPVRRAR